MSRATCPGCHEVHRVAVVWHGQGWCSEECLRETVDQHE